jgi:hypothetical protein
MRSAEYSLIEYSFEDKYGKLISGSAQAPRLSHIYPDGRIEIRFNPKNYEESLPAVSVPGYKTAHGWTSIFALVASLGMFLVTRRLWREGSKQQLLGMNRKGQDWTRHNK